MQTPSKLTSKLITTLIPILLLGLISACGGGSTPTENNNGGNGNPGNGGGGSTTQFSLSVTLSGSGSVISSPSGVDCGSTCSANFDENTNVSLTQTPATGFVFINWSGACSGSGECSVTLSSDQSVTATFQQESTENFTLTVETGEGGTIFSSPSGIDCGTNCNSEFSSNTTVVLSTTSDNGFVFDSWGGDCSGQTCNIAMSQDRNVTASFKEGTLSIVNMGNHEISHGDVFTFQPEISGGATICRKDLGHDDVRVDSETGEITWDTSALNFGRGFHIRIKCSNFNESVYASMVVHVDKSGTSRLRVAGEAGVSEFIGTAGRAMTSGDTIVFPDGNYPVSVTSDESYENAYNRDSPTSGTSEQYSTIISESPGGVTINGEAHDGIGKQKKAFELGENSYLAIVGFVIKNVQRESLTTRGTNTKLLLNFLGAQGAGTNLLPCDSFSAASTGDCSNAGMRFNGGTGLFQNSYDWGHNRYGIMTNRTDGSITRRSFVRLDEHKGDQPYGGFSNYCDTLHLGQDNTVFDSLAIAAPHYKNYAGLAAYPATGCESIEATLKEEGLLAINNKLSLSLMDVEAGPNHIWTNIVSYDSEGTCTPQNTKCGLWLLQAPRSRTIELSNSFFGKARGFEGGTSISVALGDNMIRTNVVVQDISSENDSGTPPEYLPETQLYFMGKSDTFHGDEGYDTLTTSRRWPIPGEDIIASNMRNYFNPDALRVGGGTVEIDGNRGAVASGESMSEYFWGYTNDKVPPLVVRVKLKGSDKRVAWEHLTGSRRNSVTGWKVICVDDNSVLSTLSVSQLTFTDSSSCSQYGVRATYASGDSGIAYTETAE